MHSTIQHFCSTNRCQSAFSRTGPWAIGLVGARGLRVADPPTPAGFEDLKCYLTSSWICNCKTAPSAYKTRSIRSRGAVQYKSKWPQSSAKWREASQEVIGNDCLHPALDKNIIRKQKWGAIIMLVALRWFNPFILAPSVHLSGHLLITSYIYLRCLTPGRPPQHGSAIQAYIHKYLIK